MKASFLVPLFASAVGCSLPSASVTPRLAFYEISGDIGATDSNSGAVATSDAERLGLMSTDSTFSPRADLEFGPAHLSVSVLAADFAGTGETEAAITIGGITISGNQDVATDFQYEGVTALLTFDVFPTGLIELGIGLGATLVDINLSIEELDGSGMRTGNNVSTEETQAIPLLGARLVVNPGKFRVWAEVAALQADIDGVEAFLADFDLAGEVRLLGLTDDRLVGNLVIGYRGIVVDAQFQDQNSEVDADFLIAGPYAGLEISF